MRTDDGDAICPLCSWLFTANGPGTNLVIAVSVSGGVSRTVEALRLARQVGATAVALTGNPKSRLAQEGELVLETAVPPLPTKRPNQIVPGSRSYIASQLMLYLCAIQLGEMRDHLPRPLANKLRRELTATADLMEETIALSDTAAQRLAHDWQDANQFVFCGAGPNYGTALFSAAKLLEASGDITSGQDMEEWAHLQYFGREVNTPTFLISAAGREVDRTMEIYTAAKAIGRRVALIAPKNSTLAKMGDQDGLLATAVPPRECFSPLLTCLPGALFAAYRAQIIGEPYFRNFGGGRSAEGGGGISRIRTSHQIMEVTRKT
ncbi:MAG: SIS domain-containing protein [Chloroflexi bacterium]|nr:SIS domain-containing protein [Chloroflexota bacterium]